MIVCYNDRVSKKQVNVRLPPELVKEAKKLCIDRNCALCNMVEDLLRKELRKESHG